MWNLSELASRHADRGIGGYNDDEAYHDYDDEDTVMTMIMMVVMMVTDGDVNDNDDGD